MGGNSFKAIGNKVYENYTDGIKIYLESTDDEYIVGRKWFSHLKDKISFESVSETRADGGCQIVRKKVQDSKASNKKAFGIVDRDILLADPLFRDSLWWEIDNDVFTSSRPYEDGDIFVLHYWELENYLLHPQALELLLADKKLTNSPSISASAIADLLVKFEADLIAVTLLSIVPAQSGIKQVADGFELQTSGDLLLTKVIEQLEVSDEFAKNERQKIQQFAENETNSITRWNKLSRMLDGKRIMYRIERLLFDNNMVNCKISLASERGVLAGHIANQNLIDPALSNWLNVIYQSAL
ncbi:MAG: DUF4435 domain-containing protein [Methylococcaceae bacterium]|nr:DUF4435 domain-containing protein [Methylococcaceae bacterium]